MRRNSLISNATRLSRYAQWYYTRYFPSQKRLTEKLLEKCQDEKLAKTVLTELKSMIIEREVLEDKIRLMFESGKSQRVIFTNLVKKGFEKGMINEILEYLGEELDTWSLTKPRIVQKIGQCQTRGRSQTEARKIAYEYPEFRHEIEDLIQQSYEENADAILVENVEKLQKQGIEKKKILERLMRRGFRYDDIKRVLK